ncbi:MAG TPA: MFS transporter [Ruminococcaceae bacterium]|nr:MFS transporter [Oscillospiraceae bacterium]
MKKPTFRATAVSCYIGYISQAIVNNFYPLLFVLFQNKYALSLSQISFLITANFGIQLLTDILSARFVDRIGYRITAVTAHFLCAAGLFLLPILPTALNPYFGLLLAVMLSGIGGGLIEVVISPIIEACPNDNKASAMSLLHSFYCWGQTAVVLLSTLAFRFFGMSCWSFCSAVWGLIPFLNAFSFLRVPLNTLPRTEGKSSPLHTIKSKGFLLFFLMMLCAGASELSMSQWASAFAEEGLQVSKAMGDLLGPCMFAVFMGISRVFYSKKGEKIRLSSYMALSGALCVVGYAVTVLAPHPVLSLAGCMLCGLAVGIMWPGTFSMAVKAIPLGGTPMFALLALAGDIGCTSGPSLTGQLSSAFGSDLRVGFAFAAVFPLLMLILALACRKREKAEEKR